MKNNGTKIETEIINYINEKKYINKMNQNMKLFLSEIFEFNIEKSIIRAYKYAENYKPDIIITANGISKYISIKNGESNSIHQEHIFSFINFLKRNGLSNEYEENILLFHFNDKTTDGSGTIRKDANEFLSKKQNEIQKINDFLNSVTLLKPLIERLLFKGEYHNLPIVDYIYHGNENEGYWAKKDDIINYLIHEKRYSSSIHISKLYYQSLHRNLKHDKYYEYRRYYVQFKWYTIREDIKYIMKKIKKE